MFKSISLIFFTSLAANSLAYSPTPGPIESGRVEPRESELLVTLGPTFYVETHNGSLNYSLGFEVSLWNIGSGRYFLMEDNGPNGLPFGGNVSVHYNFQHKGWSFASQAQVSALFVGASVGIGYAPWMGEFFNADVWIPFNPIFYVPTQVGVTWPMEDLSDRHYKVGTFLKGPVSFCLPSATFAEIGGCDNTLLYE